MLKVGIMAHPYKSLFVEQFPQIIRKLKNSGFQVFCSDSIFKNPAEIQAECDSLTDTEIAKESDVILSFGGDGTMLRTVQMICEQETPVMGVNVGGLGFLTEIPLENFDKICQILSQENYIIEERMMLEGSLGEDKKPMYALNEITIEKGRSTRVIEVKVDIDNNYFNDIVADGLIISTPTGSTGYSLSSGGPIVVPSSNCMILNPICPHSLTNRPVIISEKSEVHTQVFTDHPEILISADNQDVREVSSRSVLNIRRAPFNAKLIRSPESDYFSILRNKLNWGEDFRDKLRWSFKS